LDKAPDAFRTISEVADDLDIPQHVLRFWETRFTQIKPMKRSGGRRYYRPDDVDLLKGIRRLLYGEGYTIRGVQRILREQGIKSVQGLAHISVAPVPAAPTRNDVTPKFDEDDVTEVDFDESEDETEAPGISTRHVTDRPAVHADRSHDFVALRPEDFPVAGKKAFSQSHATSLAAALDDLVACKKLVEDALKSSPPDIFSLK
jgi:DNA-binding transcriptional MerR regulator